MNNQEIASQFQKQLESGKAFIYGIKETSNPNQMQLEIAQQVDAPTDGKIDFNAVSLGWKTNTINRHWQGVSVANLQKMGGRDVIGKPVEEAYAALLGGTIIPVSIRTEQYTMDTDPVSYKSNVIDPVHAGREGAKPLVNPQTKLEITHKGKSIYRKTMLVEGDYTPEVHQLKLDYDKVVVGEGVSQAVAAPAIA